MTAMTTILTAIGGGGGAVTRYFLGQYITRKTTATFPLHTFLINFTGSFVLGLLFGQYSTEAISTVTWSVCGVGFLGGYTTFSTFGYETITLLVNKQIKMAVKYVLLSSFLCVVASYLGMYVASI